MSANSQGGSRPTVVLVDRTIADASSWNDVVERLQAEGVQGTAAARTRYAGADPRRRVGTPCRIPDGMANAWVGIGFRDRVAA